MKDVLGFRAALCGVAFIAASGAPALAAPAPSVATGIAAAGAISTERSR